MIINTLFRQESVARCVQGQATVSLLAPTRKHMSTRKAWGIQQAQQTASIAWQHFLASVTTYMTANQSTLIHKFRMTRQFTKTQMGISWEIPDKLGTPILCYTNPSQPEWPGLVCCLATSASSSHTLVRVDDWTSMATPTLCVFLRPASIQTHLAGFRKMCIDSVYAVYHVGALQLLKLCYVLANLATFWQISKAQTNDVGKTDSTHAFAGELAITGEMSIATCMPSR